ncbi:MAG: hypothetical protein Q4D61_05100 [Cardiobacteriaceae bacterium]|nr:hypothetical protein [Cardiobacteriaceae bacterium]
MSFAYLIITSQPCPVLSQTRGGSFALLATTPGQYLYFRFDESGLYTRRSDETEAVITSSGMDFLRRVYQANQGKFLFADILLRHRESAADFAQSVVKQLAAKKITTIHAQENRIIRLRQAYWIEVLA